MEHKLMVEEYLQTLGLHNRELDFMFLCDLVAHHVATYSFSSVGCQLAQLCDFDSINAAKS
jgi:hypothetical protein